jgi:hypothetical protein
MHLCNVTFYEESIIMQDMAISIYAMQETGHYYCADSNRLITCDRVITG